MPDYIDREDAITAVGEAIAEGRSWYDALLKVKAADVKPVVRCKDCFVQRICRSAQWLGVDGYCSQGDRGDDNEHID